MPRIRSMATAMLLGLAALLLGTPAALAAGPCANKGLPPSAQASLAPRAPVFAAVEQLFPSEYAQLCDRLLKAQRHAQSAWIAAAARDELSTLAMTHILNVGRAPYAELIAYQTAYAQVLDALEAQDYAACAAYVTSGNMPNGMRPPVLALENRMHVAYWRAAAAGRDRPVTRPITARLLPNDRIQFITALRAQGLDDAGIATLATRDGLSSEFPPRQCAIGRISAHAIAAMAPDPAGRLIFAQLRLPRELLAPPN